MTRPLRVLVVGARFGEVYLNAFQQDPVGGALPEPVLAGMLARGSSRARRLAHAHGVPLYTELAELPLDLDLACVVVRGGAMGGDGCVLAENLLRRGLHVIIEHPLHPVEVERLQTVAALAGRLCWINSHYPHTPAGRAWIAQARRVLDSAGGAMPEFAHLATSRQLLYSSLDLLAQAINVSPDEIEVTQCCASDDEEHPFRTIRLRLMQSMQRPGSEALLQLQNYLDPTDPDMHSLVMHRITLGWPAGYLSLDATHGPVTWTPTLALPGHHDTSSPWLANAPADHGLMQPTSVTLHAPPATWQAALEIDAPRGVALLLADTAAAIADGALSQALTPAWQLALARLWQRVQRAAGPAREVALPAPPRLEITRLPEPLDKGRPGC
ncbi:Gfo/Idh/MocA family oxidoreductase [Cupriavidus sp. BIS7]|uniref:Gfo/Idh/MocA family oxidoreductase n=1 Tax=Cupriavidus sp. BIS7 TaxID=1217718 RepID=UPI0002DD477C|nr:Gfo/Idh/MocA family oxidoreductase [Cupriavidus sp. BIS7]